MEADQVNPADMGTVWRPSPGIELIHETPEGIELRALIIERKGTKGRPAHVLTPEGQEVVRWLASFELTQEQIAQILHVPLRTLTSERNGKAFRKAMEGGNLGFEEALKMALIQCALNTKNPRVLMFLAKNYLGMSERPRPPPVMVSPIEGYILDLLDGSEETPEGTGG